MVPGKKLVLTALVSVLALACATVTAYWFSIWWRGGRVYGEFIALVCAGAAASLTAVLLIAITLRKKRGAWAVVRASALLVCACVAAGAGIFFGVLENCGLSCGAKVAAESRSPNGRSNAKLLSQTCTAVSRYCPPISHVAVEVNSEGGAIIEKTVFSIGSDTAAVELHWDTADRLAIRYWPLARILRQEDRLGAVQIVYVPIPVL